MIVVISGDYGKPRPAVVLQADIFDGLPSVIIAPCTSEILDATLVRISVPPSLRNGLRVPSQIMIDKISAIPRSRVGEVVGQLEPAILAVVETAARRLLSL